MTQDSDLKNDLTSSKVVGGVQGLAFDAFEYDGFQVEVAYAGKTGEDYVVHFYPPTNRPNDSKLRSYWLEIFPIYLDRIAQGFFDAKFPRLKAAYVEENASWWFRAYGLANGIAPQERIEKFFEKLNQALLVVNQTP